MVLISISKDLKITILAQRIKVNSKLNMKLYRKIIPLKLISLPKNQILMSFSLKEELFKVSLKLKMLWLTSRSNMEKIILKQPSSITNLA